MTHTSQKVPRTSAKTAAGSLSVGRPELSRSTGAGMVAGPADAVRYNVVRPGTHVQTPLRAVTEQNCDNRRQSGYDSTHRRGVVIRRDEGLAAIGGRSCWNRFHEGSV